MTKLRFRLTEVQTPSRHGWMGQHTRLAPRRRLTVPQELPLRTTDAESYLHMRYARTLPLLARGDLELSRHRATLAQVAPAFDGLVIDADRPLSILRILDRAGFVPARDGDLAMLATAFYELALTLRWRVHERHAGHTHAEHSTAIRWPREDLCVAPPRGSVLLRVRVAGNGVQLAVYSREPVA